MVEWAKKGYELGAGEILLTSVDKEGTKKGFDIELVKAVSDIVPIDRKSVGKGKSVDLGGRRIIKKKRV